MTRPSNSTRSIAASAALAVPVLWIVPFARSGARGLVGAVVVLGGLVLAAAVSRRRRMLLPVVLAVAGAVAWRTTGDQALTVAHLVVVWATWRAVGGHRIARVVLANVTVLLVGLAIVDATAWVVRRDDVPVVPEPYRDSPYYGEEFRAERKEFSDLVETGRGTVERSIGGVLVRTNADYAGRYITIVDGRRVTPGGPATGPRILLFGGSTILDAEVPDAYTVAAQLQTLVGDAYRVENYGVSGASLGANVDWMAHADLGEGDVVVTLSGVNNVGGVADRGARFGWLYGVLDAPRFEPARRRLWTLSTLHGLANAPVYGRDASAVAEAVTTYERDLGAAARTASSVGARYLNALQPHLWTTRGAALTDSERRLSDSWGTTFRGVVEEAYAELAVVATGRPDAVDLRGTFDEKRTPIFFDWHHVNEEGNRMLAGAIHAELARRGWLADE